MCSLPERRHQAVYQRPRRDAALDRGVVQAVLAQLLSVLKDQLQGIASGIHTLIYIDLRRWSGRDPYVP